MPFWGRIGRQCFRNWHWQSAGWPRQSRNYAVAPPTSSMAGGQRAAENSHPWMPRGPSLEQFAAVRFYAAPVQAVKPKKEERGKKEHRINDAITGDYIRLVTDEGHSIVSLRDALDRAMKLKLDLVEVGRKSKPPVCKIMDYNKAKYQRKIYLKNRLKSKTHVYKGVPKVVRFTRKIMGDGVLDSGHRSKLQQTCTEKRSEDEFIHGRDPEQKDLQVKADLVKRLMDRGCRVKIEDTAFVESGPFVQKSQAYVVVRHIKFSKNGNKKKGRKETAAVEGTCSEVHTDPVQGSSWTEEVDASEDDLETEYDVSDDEADEDHISTAFSDATVSGGEELTEIQKPIISSKPLPEPQAKPANGKVATNEVVVAGDISSHSEPLPFLGENHYHQRGNVRAHFQDLKPNESSSQATGTKTKTQAYGFPSQVERLHMNNRGPGRNEPLRPGHPSANQRWEAQEPPNLVLGRNEPLRPGRAAPTQRWEAREAPNSGPGRNQPLRPDCPSPNQRWGARDVPNLSPATERQPLKQSSVAGNTKHDPSDAKQGQSVSSYGIFSAPRTATASGDQKAKSSSSGGIHHSQDPSELKAGNQRQDADDTSQKKGRIFSR
ncbi:hypothetical protein ACLOJK_033607 [Asimina triloba]